uniref:Uncharacterized protein n=1 Tax=mine drainage metagenome TaxID=410659 RepID=E6QC94_9ZZZZ
MTDLRLLGIGNRQPLDNAKCDDADRDGPKEEQEASIADVLYQIARQMIFWWFQAINFYGRIDGFLKQFRLFIHLFIFLRQRYYGTLTVFLRVNLAVNLCLQILFNCGYFPERP